MKTRNEYPAAHSVDTYWYAVDSYGHLALIGSGEDGLLPAEMEPGVSLDDESIIEDALDLNSSPICDGCRRLILPENLIENVRKWINHENLFKWFPCVNTDGKLIKRGQEDYDFYEMTIELSENVRFDDLAVWKERTESEKTRVFEISEDHRLLYCKYLSFRGCALKRDVDEGRIIAVGFFPDEMFDCLYFPIISNSEEAFVEREVSDNTPPMFSFNLPDGFHGLRKIDVNFDTTVEIDLDDHMGMYISDLEQYNSDDDELLIWPDYNGHSREQLENDLYEAIMKHRSRSVWCLLDQYGISPHVFFQEVGKTAIQLSEYLYEQNKYVRSDGSGFSFYRIRQMMRLKERQLCGK